VILLVFCGKAEARFASRFSLAVGEEYSDNIFFSEKKTHDFITVLNPTLSFIYQPTFRPNSQLTFDLSVPAEFFVRHSGESNFGDRLSLQANYLYQYSSRLNFTARECLSRRGETRTGGFDDLRGGGQGFGNSSGTGGLSGSTTFGGFSSNGGCGGFGNSGGLGRVGGEAGLGDSDLVTRGEVLSNTFDIRSRFSYSPIWSFDGSYRSRYMAFFDEGGREISHKFEIGTSYHRWQQHNLRARYSIEILKSRDGKTDILHDIDAGDDFFSNRQIQLTPTLSILASTGLGLQTGDSDFRLRHTLDVALVKIWRLAQFVVGVKRGLTGSQGVSGPSFTTDFFTGFQIQLTRRLVGMAGAELSLYDTDNQDYETFQALAGFQYWLASWVAVNLAYNFQRFDPERQNGDTSSILSQGIVDSNSVFLSLVAYFDLWPNLGLAHGAAASHMLPTFSPVRGPAGGPVPSSSGPSPQQP
jgi:hypothetical protein